MNTELERDQAFGRVMNWVLATYAAGFVVGFSFAFEGAVCVLMWLMGMLAFAVTTTFTYRAIVHLMDVYEEREGI